MINSSGKRVLVLGQGPQVQALVATLAALPGVQSVRQQASYTLHAPLPNADLCIELLEGLSVAHSAAMQALAQGMGLVVGSPMLAATHGQLLETAARGQGAYFCCAAHGLGALPTLLQSAQAFQLLWLPHSAAQGAIGRMYARTEMPELALRQLQLRGTETTDGSGKITHAKAHALLGAWQGVWLQAAKQARVGLEHLTLPLLPLLNKLELKLVYGCRLTAHTITTTPMVMAATDAPVVADTETLIATTSHGEMRLTLPAGSGLNAAILQAVQAFSAGQRRVARVPAMLAERGEGLQLVVGEASMPPQVLAEAKAGTLRVAVVSQEVPVPEGCFALPVAGGYAPPMATKLRLVG
jgi:hypothetical protein